MVFGPILAGLAQFALPAIGKGIGSLFGSKIAGLGQQRRQYRQPVRRRMREAGDRGVEAGVEMCRSLLHEARPHVEGAYLMPSFGRYEVVARVAEGARP